MEENNSYQSIDIPANNPIELPKQKLKIDLKDPKIKILFILGIILAVLVILSLFVVIFRKPTIKAPSPTPTPAAVVQPTIKESNIPEEFVGQFDLIESEIQTKEDFVPPQIDTEIGL